jgi:NAD(P)-dependent dehydrogenase (short-subunit alcohol dehydrogenase family)
MSRALVTGGARGIGEAIARRLAADGARVAIADVDEAGARDVAAQLGDGALGLRCDVRSADDVRAAVDAATASFGGLDLLVNNAGIEIAKPLAEVTDEEFDRLMDINVNGVFRCTKAALPALSGGGGAIVNIASVAGMRGSALQVAYCASKAAVIRMTEVCALELRPLGIRVNAVCPGLVDTDMATALRAPAEALTGMPFDELVAAKQGRLGTPEEVAEMVAFLASDDAAFITGAHYALDGGMTGALL